MRAPKVYVVLSVDWEPNHGPWATAGKTEYGGILAGTPALESLLDQVNVPCTWLVESSGEEDRDLPRLFPQVVDRLRERTRDEVGLHVHWRRRNGDGSMGYETRDEAWVREQIQHGIETLGARGVRPRSFRSGALLHVRRLPGILHELSFDVDSSTLWGRANRPARRTPLQRAASLSARMLGSPRAPYFTDGDDVEEPGGSGVVEFPIFSGLLESRRPLHSLLQKTTLWKSGLRQAPTFLTFFFHIDELLLPGRPSGAGDAVDEPGMQLLEDQLRALRARPDTAFVTLTEARAVFVGEKA
jgi:hypothetical protein